MPWKEQLKNLALSAVVCLGITWLTDRQPPVTFHNIETIYQGGPEQSVNPTPGGAVGVSFLFDRDRSCRTYAERWFIDALRWKFDLPNELFTPDETGDDMRVNKFVALDPRTHLGMGTLQIDVFYYCNPVHYLWPIKVTLRVPTLVMDH